MAMEPIYFTIIVVLLVLLIVQVNNSRHWRRAASEWQRAAGNWRRLAYDHEHHRIGRAHISSVDLSERTEDQ